VQAAFARAVGVAADPNHAKGGGGPRDGGVEADLPIHLRESVVNDLRQPEGGTVQPEDDRELREAADPDPQGTEGILQAEGVFALGEFAVLLEFEFFQDEGFFGCGEPMGMGRAIGQKKRNGQSNQDRRDAFQNEEPLPRVETVPAIGNLEDPSGERAAQNAGGGDGGHEHGGHVGPVFAGEPVGQVQDDAWEKAGFGHAEKEAEDIEGGRTMAEGHDGGDDSPTDHDAGDPKAGSGAVEDDVAGDFEEEVAKEEDAGAGGKDGIREPGDAVHGQFGEANVDAVDVGEDVTGEEDGDESEGDLAVDEGRGHGGN